MKLAAGVVAILLIPFAIVFIDPTPLTPFYIGAMVALAILGAGLFGVAYVLEPKKGPDERIDERRVDRHMNVLALDAAIVIAIGALLFSSSRTSLVPVVCGVAILWTVLWIPPFMRRVDVTTRVTINRDPATVFRFMLDARNQTRYTPELIAVEKLTEGDIRPGTQFLSRVRLDAKGVYEGVEEIVDIDWGRRITERVANSTRNNLGVMTFEPMQAATLLSYRFESVLSYPGALFGQGLLRPLLTAEMSKRRAAIWARLKRLLESEAGA